MSIIKHVTLQKKLLLMTFGTALVVGIKTKFVPVLDVKACRES